MRFRRIDATRRTCPFIFSFDFHILDRIAVNLHHVCHDATREYNNVSRSSELEVGPDHGHWFGDGEFVGNDFKRSFE